MFVAPVVHSGCPSVMLRTHNVAIEDGSVIIKKQAEEHLSLLHSLTIVNENIYQYPNTIACILSSVEIV